jgi:hypothetical protein
MVQRRLVAALALNSAPAMRWLNVPMHAGRQASLPQQPVTACNGVQDSIPFSLLIPLQEALSGCYGTEQHTCAMQAYRLNVQIIPTDA